MNKDWKPTDVFYTLVQKSGFTREEVTPDLLGEFLSYWITKPDIERTQGEWENTLLRNVIHKLRGARYDALRLANSANATRALNTKPDRKPAPVDVNELAKRLGLSIPANAMQRAFAKRWDKYEANRKALQACGGANSLNSLSPEYALNKFTAEYRKVLQNLKPGPDQSAASEA